VHRLQEADDPFAFDVAVEVSVTWISTRFGPSSAFT
jgi:hypothetical protein